MSGPRWAYWIKDRSPDDIVRQPPARLKAAWPKNPGDAQGCWMVYRHPNGQGSLVVFPRLDGAACALSEFAEPRETADGWMYYPSKEAPSGDFLIKPESARGQGEWISTYEGQALFIGLAFATPRRLALSMAGIQTKDSVSEFGQLAHAIFDEFFSKEGMQTSDPRVARFLFLALRENYTVTEEMAEDWTAQFLTDRDITPIGQVALGAGPKQLAAALASLPSADPTTGTSR